MENAEKIRMTEDDAAVDVISGLPDCLLTTILSFLPTRESARTALLSSRWRHVWKSVPLNFHDFLSLTRNPPDDDSLARDVTAILASHLGPVRRFCLVRTLFRARESLAHSWFQTLALKRVQDVDLDFPSPGHAIPPSLLACESLLTLRLRNSHFPDAAAAAAAAHLNLIRLSELTLSSTYLTEADLRCILSTCTALRSLAVENNSSVRRIRLRSGSLLSLTLSECRLLEELIIEDAPNLERLLVRNLMLATRVKVVAAPKLAMLGKFRMPIRRLELGDTVFTHGADVTLSSLMHSLKTLAVVVSFECKDEVQMLTYLLRCFPCLETLHVECCRWISKVTQTFRYWELQKPIACLDRHLKAVKLSTYIGLDFEQEFVKFLSKKASALEVLRVQFAMDCCKSVVSRQKSFLRRLNRPSVQISFFNEKLRNQSFCTDASNLSFSDPFDS